MCLFSGIPEYLGILKMMEHNYRSLKELKPYVNVLTLVLVIIFFFPALSLSRSKKLNRDNHLQDTQNYHKNMRSKDRNDFILLDKHGDYKPLSRRSPYPLLTKNYRNKYNRMSPEEKTMLEKRYQEWESLPEHKQQMLRRRMEKYKRLPPKERERFQQRHRQLKKLPPDERYKIREKLQKWDRLSPDEKEQIRQRFRGQ
jgi:Protein of unknown function (DUF3106)